MMPTSYRTDSPAFYEIRIAGILDEHWSGYLGGLSITTAQSGEDEALVITTLKGQLIDQTALMGVLNTLYDYQYLLLAVARQCGGQSESEHEQNCEEI